MENYRRLIIVGTGIQLGHLTIESDQAIKSAKKLLYLVSDVVTEDYLQESNETAESLIGFYKEGKDRLQTYEEMVEYILKNLQEYKELCVAFYGHPGVFTYPSHKAIKKAREMGYEAKMLPGISTEDMIFSELGIDPAVYGLQTFEASSFLYNKYIFDPNCYIILWQVGVLGLRNYVQEINVTKELTQLSNLLLETYPKNHELILYQSSTHRIVESTIIRTRLNHLSSAEFDPISTMIIPPLKYKTQKNLKENDYT